MNLSAHEARQMQAAQRAANHDSKFFVTYLVLSAILTDGVAGLFNLAVMLSLNRYSYAYIYMI